MKFLISRVSLWNDDISPCEEAEKESYTRIEVRTLNTFEQFDEKFARREGLWISKGINHCINNDGYIQREIPNGNIGWFIEINSLEELVRFKDRHGDLVIRTCYDNKNIIKLEIYDDYRE